MFHDAPESDSTSQPLLVSSLDVRINSSSRKAVQYITLDLGTTKRQIRKAISPGEHHEELFDPPLVISPLHKILISIHYQGMFGGVVPISLDRDTILRDSSEKDGKQVYSTTERNIELEIGIQPLPSTVHTLVGSYDRFRLLVIGKSGVGKSSLINKMFDVSGVDVSDTTRGKAEIDREYTAPDNSRFIVHDTRGFEAAEQGNLDVVRDFMKDRKCMPHLKDRLHAVWLCLETPFAGGRVIEAGVEKFLRDRKEILGDVPLVVVFTKLDLLVGMLRADALQAGKLLSNDTLQKQKEEELEKRCLKPLRKAAGKDVSYVFVSTKDGYKDSLSLLVERTVRNIRTYVKDEAPQYIAANAQRVNIALKLEATIAVAERRYWNALEASPDFKGHTMKECLGVLHDDIITVWNFREPHSLRGESFKEGLLQTYDLSVRVTEYSRSRLATAGAMMSRRVYIASPDTVKQLMAYIIELTCVMQILFLLTAVKGGVSDEAIGIAMTRYENLYRCRVRTDVDGFPADLAIAPGKRDEVLDKIKELINKYCLSDKDIFELQHEVRGLVKDSDTAWDAVQKYFSRDIPKEQSETESDSEPKLEEDEPKEQSKMELDSERKSEDDDEGWFDERFGPDSSYCISLPIFS